MTEALARASFTVNKSRPIEGRLSLLGSWTAAVKVYGQLIFSWISDLSLPIIRRLQRVCRTPGPVSKRLPNTRHRFKRVPNSRARFKEAFEHQVQPHRGSRTPGPASLSLSNPKTHFKKAVGHKVSLKRECRTPGPGSKSVEHQASLQRVCRTPGIASNRLLKTRSRFKRLSNVSPASKST